jgi:hypothetical protein
MRYFSNRNKDISLTENYKDYQGNDVPVTYRDAYKEWSFQYQGKDFVVKTLAEVKATLSKPSDDPFVPVKALYIQEYNTAEAFKEVLIVSKDRYGRYTIGNQGYNRGFISDDLCKDTTGNRVTLKRMLEITNSLRLLENKADEIWQKKLKWVELENN